MHSSPEQKIPSDLWDAVFIAGGLLLVSLTFKTYRYFDLTSPADLHNHLTASEADHSVADAKARISSRPDDYNAWADLAIAYYQKGPDSYVDGLNALDKAREMGATQESLFYYAGIMDQTLGLPDYAINELSKYLRHHPDDYETLVRLGNLYFSEKKFDEARVIYKAALAQWPKDPTAWFNYAVVSKEQGQLDEALDSLERVRKLAGHLPEGGYYQQGEILRLKGSQEAAMQSYQQELAANPNSIPTLEALELAARSQGDLKLAKAFHKRIFDLKHATPTAAVK